MLWLGMACRQNTARVYVMRLARANQFPCTTDQLRDLPATCNRLSRIAPVLEGIFPGGTGLGGRAWAGMLISRLTRTIRVLCLIPDQRIAGPFDPSEASSWDREDDQI